jgi:hypothetical protein
MKIEPALFRGLSAKLTKFIDSKLKEYVEPTRMGTPKGEAVGFSLTKYQATLFTLRESLLDNEDLKAQARRLGISYGLLRKWRSEQSFKALVSQHEKEFVNHLLAGFIYSGYGVWDGDGVEKAESMLLQALQQAKQKESARKLMPLIYGKIQADLMKSNATAADLRKYQMHVLDQAIELLADRQSAIKHRKDVISLLSGIRKSMA